MGELQEDVKEQQLVRPVRVLSSGTSWSVGLIACQRVIPGRYVDPWWK